MGVLRSIPQSAGKSDDTIAVVFQFNQGRQRCCTVIESVYVLNDNNAGKVFIFDASWFIVWRLTLKCSVVIWFSANNQCCSNQVRAEHSNLWRTVTLVQNHYSDQTWFIYSSDTRKQQQINKYMNKSNITHFCLCLSDVVIPFETQEV